MVDVADLLLERGGVPAAESDVAPEAPGLHLVAAALQEELERHERHLVGHEARQQQDRVAVPPRRTRERRQACGERHHLQEGAGLEELVEEAGLSDVRVSAGHGSRGDGSVRPCGRRVPL